MADDNLQPQNPIIRQFLGEAAARLAADRANMDRIPYERNTVRSIDMMLAYIPTARSLSRGERVEHCAVLLHGAEARHVEIVFADSAVFRMPDGSVLSFAARTGDVIDDGWMPWVGSLFCVPRRYARGGPFIEPRTFNRDTADVRMASCVCCTSVDEHVDSGISLYEFMRFRITPRQADLLFVAATGPSGYHAEDCAEPYADGLLRPARFNDWGGWWATLPGLHSRASVYDKAFCSQFIHWALSQGEIASDTAIFGENRLLHDKPCGAVTPPMIVRAFLEGQMYGDVQAAAHPTNPESTARPVSSRIRASEGRPAIRMPALNQ